MILSALAAFLKQTDWMIPRTFKRRYDTDAMIVKLHFLLVSEERKLLDSLANFCSLTISIEDTQAPKPPDPIIAAVPTLRDWMMRKKHVDATDCTDADPPLLCRVIDDVFPGMLLDDPSR
jgi:hypothetical protein